MTRIHEDDCAIPLWRRAVGPTFVGDVPACTCGLDPGGAIRRFARRIVRRLNYGHGWMPFYYAGGDIGCVVHRWGGPDRRICRRCPQERFRMEHTA